MHIIDYLRDTLSPHKGEQSTDGGNAIELPAYHRGHLGFLPNTSVFMGIHGDGHRFEKGCELIISSYPSVTANLAELSCTMVDSIGVVNKLLIALKSLNVNILIAETYSIKHHKQHHLELVFDWSSSSLPRSEEVPIAFQSTVNRLHKLLPNNDFRYARLLARILQCCAGDLVWEKDAESHFSLPSVRLRSFENRSTFTGTGRSSIVRVATEVASKSGAKKSSKSTSRKDKKTAGSSRGFKSKFLIALGDIEYDLRRILDISSLHPEESQGQGPLPYLMLSDTASRCLRVWFPQNTKKARQILHLGFRHSDISGALETITKVLRFSGFNLVTSLLRRGQQGQNVWEVHLQADFLDDSLQGILGIGPRRERLKKMIDWFCSKVSVDTAKKGWESEFGAHSEPPDITSDLKRFKVYVRAPEYPVIRDAIELEKPFLWEEDEKADPGSGRETAGPDQSEDESKPASTERRQWAASSVAADGPLDSSGRRWARALTLTDGVPVPRVFLSYPSTATDHAERIKAAIAKDINNNQGRYGGGMPCPRLIVDEYQEPNLLEISDSVFRKIRRADFFLGIWHSDKGQPKSISPWMPYEYGVASALGKPAAVIVRDTIPPKVWNRIDPHISKPIYNDLSFQEDTVGRVIEYIESQWLMKISEEARNSGMKKLWGEEVPDFS